jgi:hypothetical protein
MVSAAGRLLRRLLRAYRVRCAREDAHRLGVRTPDGVWSCAPCRAVFLDTLGYVGHLHEA